ncbi:MAG: DUF3025 domain-containing protein [Burkholderiaceae bacterium]|nr:DUF3025 domain-containing protein [Burkholderiaceae bacterium]
MECDGASSDVRRTGAWSEREHADGLDAVWFDPFQPWAARSDPRPAGRIDLVLLNGFATARGVRTEAGLPLRFVEARLAAATAYECSIGESGAVPTRVHGPGMLHDWFNALAWLAFPRIKARLNRLHGEALAACAGSGTGRGALRDAATLLDENGALFVCRDPSLAACLCCRDWRALFVDGRERFVVGGVTVRVLGHDLCEKLLAPYKAMCAHAWVVELPPDSPAGQCGDALDAMVATRLQPETLRVAKLCPLPLLGVPGWWPANADPAFYDDPVVFRRARREREERNPPSLA